MLAFVYFMLLVLAMTFFGFAGAIIFFISMGVLWYAFSAQSDDEFWLRLMGSGLVVFISLVAFVTIVSAS
jgi:hypothetical protein